MAVYIDEMNASYGRMKMCHMLADTKEELLEMADAVGLDRRWLQKAGTPHEHFDICKSKKAAAVERGAVIVSVRELGKLLVAKRASGRSSE